MLLDKSSIDGLTYNELIGIVRETNRPPGGFSAISRIARETFLRPEVNVLEIGTSTGVTAIELASLTGCNVTGIDINPVSLDEAKRRAKERGVSELCKFQECDATATHFAADTFDVVFCGNVTSLISKRAEARAEYARVLKTGGFLAAIPMYYLREPSESLLQSVRTAIGVPITPLYREYWRSFFLQPPFSMHFEKHYTFDELDEKKVDNFVELIFERDHLKALPDRVRNQLREKYRSCMQIFRVNLAHMGFSIFVLRLEDALVDPVLFTASDE